MSFPIDANQESGYSNSRLVKRLLALSWRYRGACVKVLFLQLLLLTIGLSGLSLAGLGVDVIRKAVMPSAPEPLWPFGMAPPSEWAAMTKVYAIAASVLGLALTRALLNYIYSMSVARLVQTKIVPSLRNEVYEKLMRLSFRYFDANASASIINRVIGDVQAVRVFVDGVLMQSVIMLLSLVVYLTFMVSIHPLLTLACLATVPLIWVASVIFSKRSRPAFVENRRLADGMILTLSESIQGIYAVKGFGREKEEMGKFKAASDRVRDQMQRIFWMVSVYSPTVGFLSHINLATLLGYGGYLVYRQELALGTGIVVFAGLLQQFTAQVASISGIANSIQRSLTGARRVFEILDAPVDIESKPDAIQVKRLRGEVEYRDVCFSYQQGDRVLENVSFRAAPGERVALVGATGSGKSALLSLLPRFYDVDSGQVLIDGKDIRDIDLDDLRRNIGIVFQESFLFSNTVAANIAFGNPGATMEQIRKAAKIAAAHDFIMDMPDGYESVIGESGSNLSGGQRQRLAIARAVLLEPAILILDDPTAAIDAETEEEILMAMENAMEGRTTFVVGHRMSLLRRADKIVVLNRGRVAQVGRHEELISRPGLYQNLARLQVVDDLRSRDAIIEDSESAGQGA